VFYDSFERSDITPVFTHFPEGSGRGGYFQERLRARAMSRLSSAMDPDTEKTATRREQRTRERARGIVLFLVRPFIGLVIV